MQLISNNGLRLPTKPGLEIPEETSADEWEAIGRKLGRVDAAYSWMVGDWWAFGERKWGSGRNVVEAPSWDGPAYSTCVSYGMVARAFRQISQRRETLSFRHHQIITALWVSRPKLANEILDWCEQPLRKGKKARSCAQLSKEINRRTDIHYPAARRSKRTKDLDVFTQFTDPILQLADNADKFDIPALAQIQIELFSELVDNDLTKCAQAVRIINSFIKEVKSRCPQSNE